MKLWVEVSASRLEHNLRAVQQAAGAETELLAVVKANAYGHGVETCSVLLARAGVRWLGVTCAQEGLRVREALAAAAIPRTAMPDLLVMSGSLPEDVDLLAAGGLTPVVWTPEHLHMLAGRPLRVHVEVDTGMGRQGVRPGAELERLLDSIAASSLDFDGIFTHLACSEVLASPQTQAQQQLFAQAIAQVQERRLTPRWVHLANSSAIDNPAQPTAWLCELAARVGARAMVRAGLALYGHCLPIEGAAAAQLAPALQPVMTWKTRILDLRTLAPGDTVGYGTTFVATTPMRVALLAAGYADGLRRELSGPRGWVMIAGRRAGIVGRISMNLTVVDVTGMEGLSVGDEAVLLGEGVTAEDHARLADTIPYEILCGVRQR